MSKVGIETLTSVHIGSGEFLNNNTDFVSCYDEDNLLIYVVNPSKILEAIGIEHVQNWVHSIEKGESTIDFVKRYNPKITCASFSSRDILSFAVVRQNDTLKECLHDGMGVPYIPGSSIKGAIRTAIFSYLAKVEKISNPVYKKSEKYKSNAKEIERELFGGDSKSDVFRFIRVGDAYFPKRCEVVYRMQNLNIRRSSDNLMDSSKQQLVETISEQNNSSFQLVIESKKYKFSAKNWNYSKYKLGDLKDSFSSEEKLFKLINKHTSDLVKSEISFWKKQSEDKRGIEVEGYLEILCNIKNCIDRCKDNECVLRIGNSSGWRFITGAWSESSELFDQIVQLSRPKNKNYEGYDFPKSRRVDKDGYPLGFVKLTILD